MAWHLQQVTKVSGRRQVGLGEKTGFFQNGVAGVMTAEGWVENMHECWVV